MDLIAAGQAALRPPPRLSYSEWADAERWLSPESSTGLQRWRTRANQREVLDAVGDPGIEGVCAIWCSQGGKTELTLNVIGYHIRHDPAPILYQAETVEKARAFSKDRVAPMIRDTPTLRDRVNRARARDSGNTVLHKQFLGGRLTMVGANSAAGLSMRPIRVLLCDEFAGYPPSAGSEGDPVRLAEARTVSFWNARKFWITSPRWAGDRSQLLWQRSDQRRWFVPCPDCGTYQYLRWAQVHWEKDGSGEHVPETALYVCEHCGVGWTDAKRWRAIRKGEYRATAPFRGIRGYHMPAMAVPGRRLAQMARQWVDAQGQPTQLQVFVNTVLAEWWDDPYKSVDKTGLLGRVEDYAEHDGVPMVPRSAVVLSAGVDTQDDRLEVQVDGWGRGEESWKLEYHVLYGDPSGKSVWDELWELLCRPRVLERGGVDYIRATCIDTGGHHTMAAYEFCRPRFRVMTPDGLRAYCFAVRGSGGQGELWPKEPSTKNRAKVPVWTLKVDAAKEAIYTRLLKVVEPGPGYIHFPRSFGEKYFAQLTAEKAVTRYDKGGFPKRQWVLKTDGARNEALDTSVYSMAALSGLKRMGFDLEDWADQVEARSAEITPDAVQPKAGAAKKKRRRRVTRSKFIGG